METPLTDSQALLPGAHLEEFLIEKVLGAGGFGITYLARDTSLGRQVVIKENLPSMCAHRDTSSLVVRPSPSHEDEENFRWSLENFSNEAEMLASLHHPGIVSVLRRFDALGTAYFIMPFAEGSALDELITERLKKNKPFSEEELRGLLEGVLSDLDHLHDRGIYRRDIKPDNIFLGVGFEPILIDLGSARWHGQNMSAERSATYSLYFSAIEQVSDRFGPIGPWTDIYQLSAVLYRCITGGKLPDAVDRVESDGNPYLPLVEIQEVTHTYPRQLLDAIDQGLQIHPQHRPRSVAEWRRSFESLLPSKGLPDNLKARRRRRRCLPNPGNQSAQGVTKNDHQHTGLRTLRIS